MGDLGPVFNTAAPDQSSFYDDIVSLGSLRLLRVAKENENDDAPRFSLEKADLDNCPPFAAVSYCWGNPYESTLIKEDGVEKLFFSEHIELNGRPFAMTPNALAALKHAAKISGLDYLWMDAICINQTSITERADQVAQMDKIFACANNVIAWLGPSHPKVHGLAFMIDEFLPAAGFLRGICGDEILLSHPPEGIALEDGFGVERYRKLQQAAEDFCKDCRWFFRTWIPQECILAREIKLYCGDICLDSQGFAQLYDLFQCTNWVNYCSPYLAQFGQWFAFAKTFHDSKLWLQGPGPNYLEAFRTQDCETGLWTLTQIVIKLRTTSCSDPRDKLYAAIPMASRYFTKDVQQFLKVDYSRDVGDIYTSYSRMIVEQTGSLSSLSSVGDRSDRKIDGLPSWVSDYSTTAPTFPQWFHSPGTREKEIQAAGYERRIRFTSDTLSAFGACFATVAAHAKGNTRSELPSGFAVLELLSSLGNYVGDPRESRTEACLKMLMNDVSRIEKPPDASIAHQIHIVDRPGPTQLFYAWLSIQLVTYAEALLKDGLDKETARAFLISILGGFEDEQKAGLVPDLEDVMTPILFGENKPYNHVLDCENAQSANTNGQRNRFEIAGFPQHPWIEEKPRDISEIIKEMCSLYVNSMQPPPLSKYSDGLHSALARRHDVFSSKMKLTLQGKESMFRTEEGFLGVGPYSLQPGDQIWFVESCYNPLAFRPTEEPDTFTLLGGCYLHGFMGNEIFDHRWGLQQKWKQFKLV